MGFPATSQMHCERRLNPFQKTAKEDDTENSSHTEQMHAKLFHTHVVAV
jgi:hypothetical protein